MDEGAREALRLMGPDPANWVPDRPGIDHNVAIIGGGQTGCALAFARAVAAGKHFERHGTYETATNA